jgi:hypothetical protein
MGIETYIDIETLPNMAEGELERITKEVAENFKAPSSLTKTQACADLGLTGDDAKYTSKDDAIAKWEERFASEKCGDVAMEQWRKQALNPDEGSILSIAFKCEGGDMWCQSIGDQSEFELLLNFWEQLRDRTSEIVGALCRRNHDPYFVGHNVPFDLAFIWKRSVILGVNCKTNIKPHGRHGSDFFDTMQAWAGYKQRISQDRLSKILGIEQKPSDISGSNVFDHYMAGNIERIKEYNMHDVETVEAIYNRIK